MKKLNFSTHISFSCMEVLRTEFVHLPRHGVLRVTAPAYSDVEMVLAEVMASELAVKTADGQTVTWLIRMLCSATTRVETQTFSFVTADEMTDGHVAIADLPNPQDAVGGPADVRLVSRGVVLEWRVVFVATNTAPQNIPVPLQGMVRTTVSKAQVSFAMYINPGVQEIAVSICSCGVRDPGPLHVDKAFVFTDDVMAHCRFDEACDDFGVHWIVLDRPCSGLRVLQLYFRPDHHTTGMFDIDVAVFSTLRNSQWLVNDRRLWTRLCVDATI